MTREVSSIMDKGNGVVVIAIDSKLRGLGARCPLKSFCLKDEGKLK